jgi:hypothetical protein
MTVLINQVREPQFYTFASHSETNLPAITCDSERIVDKSLETAQPLSAVEEVWLIHRTNRIRLTPFQLDSLG